MIFLGESRLKKCKITIKTPTKHQKRSLFTPFSSFFSYLCTLEEYKSGFCETQVRFSKAAFPQCAPHFCGLQPRVF